MSFKSFVRDYFHFLRVFFLRPYDIGAVIPSSRTLSEELLSDIDFTQQNYVVELGPGTGAITQIILEKLKSHGLDGESKYFGLDLQEHFVKLLKHKFPGAKFELGSAEDLTDFYKQSGFSLATLIVSAIPLTLLKKETQHRILSNVLEVLAPDGEFVTFTYAHASKLPMGRKLVALLEEFFTEVKVMPVVWKNIPPAIVYKCKR